jgi:hypothetical protein
VRGFSLLPLAELRESKVPLTPTLSPQERGEGVSRAIDCRPGIDRDSLLRLADSIGCCRCCGLSFRLAHFARLACSIGRWTGRSARPLRQCLGRGCGRRRSHDDERASEPCDVREYPHGTRLDRRSGNLGGDRRTPYGMSGEGRMRTHPGLRGTPDEYTHTGRYDTPDNCTHSPHRQESHTRKPNRRDSHHTRKPKRPDSDTRTTNRRDTHTRMICKALLQSRSSRTRHSHSCRSGQPRSCTKPDIPNRPHRHHMHRMQHALPTAPLPASRIQRTFQRRMPQ